jgi:hypothetical protein
MQPIQRNYQEYLIDNIEPLTPEEFDVMLSNENYSLLLIWRLLELKDYFISIEAFEMVIPIRDWCDLHKVNLEADTEDI